VSRAYIGLGANLGDPEQQLQRAAASLHNHADISCVAASPIYRSAPLGPEGQPDYLNAVIALDTTLQPLALLDVLQGVEDALGRQREERWGPRLIDLDLLIYGEQQINHERLVVPHPEIARRNFVLEPLIDILGPRFRLPGGEELDTLLTRCPGGRLARTSSKLDYRADHGLESGA